MSPTAGNMLVEEIAPRLRSTIPHAVPRVGTEDIEELVQDAVAMAASILTSAERRGKSVTPGNIAYYATRLIKSGRRSTGSSKTDVLSPGSQLNGDGHCHVRSLEEPVGWDEGTGEPLTLGEVLASEAEDPSVTGALRHDWCAMLATLDEKARMIVTKLANERPLQEVAVAYRISRSSVQTLKEKLKKSVIDFMGEDVLAQVQRLPFWKHGIRARRERQECRMERRA